MTEDNFLSLRKEIALKAGSVLENILRDINIINSLDKVIKEYSNKNGSLDKAIYILQNQILYRLETSKELVREGMIGSLKMSFDLQEEVISKETLENQNKILKEIVISRENISNWRNFTTNLLKKLHTIFHFDSFFILSKKDLNYELDIFYLNNNIKKEIKSRIKYEIYEKYKIEDISVNEKTVLKVRKRGKYFHIKTQEFLKDDPHISGTIGIVIALDKSLNKREEELLSSILSILTLVVGSIKALYNTLSELEFYAGHDSLTKLYNRRMFEEFLKYEVARAKRRNYKFSVILLDLDNFKEINDTFGHQAGDILLKKIADIIEYSIRDGDIAARIGGDEFAVILPETEIKEAKYVAERLRKNLESSYLVVQDNIKININASMGLVEHPTHGTDVDMLLTSADIGMYKAKSLGKNRVSIPEEKDIRFSLVKKREFETQLLKVISNKDIEIDYQPVFDKNNNILGFELFSKLKIKNREIRASEFIEELKRLDKLYELDLIVLEKIFNNKKIREGNYLIFINLSPKTVLTESLWQHMLNYVEKNSFNPERIVWEIDESIFFDNINKIENFIKFFEEDKFKIAIDNFGTHCSPYSYLRQISIDYAKFDTEFNFGVIENKKVDISFMKSILNFCKDIDVKTVAKNIENEKMYEKMKNFNFDYYQGFYLSAPQKEIVLK